MGADFMKIEDLVGEKWQRQTARSGGRSPPSLARLVWQDVKKYSAGREYDWYLQAITTLFSLLSEEKMDFGALDPGCSCAGIFADMLSMGKACVAVDGSPADLVKLLEDSLRSLADSLGSSKARD